MIVSGVSILTGETKACIGAVVVIVTVAFVADVPFNEMGLGETVQVVRVGLPPQLSVTLWLNPPDGTTETV